MDHNGIFTAIAAPDPVRSAVEGYDWTPVTDGKSGGSVFRLKAHGQPTMYLKYGVGRVADDITAEMTRLEWMAARLPVPKVLHFVRSLGEAFLLTTAIDGSSAYDFLIQHPKHRTETAAALGHFLRTLHSLPLADCPFHAGHELRLADARQNLEAGWVDTSDFDAEHEGWTAEQVWAEALTLLPLPFERVITHGDCSPANILLENGRVTGCIDVGRAGAADPYQDLAILWHNLEEFGGDVQRELFRAYGIAEPDERKLRFHLCLDEFF